MIDFQFVGVKKISLYEHSEWLEKIIIHEKKKLGEIVYVFCTDNYLLEKNIKFLNHNTLTDVITFDYCNNNIISGDILISIERVYENAKEYNVNFVSELNRVMIHGLLHLLGYKDKTKTESKLMRVKENYYLSKI